MSKYIHIMIMMIAIFSCITPVVCIFRAMRERHSKALVYFILVIFSALLTSLGVFMAYLSQGESALVLAEKIVYSGRIICANMIPLFIIEYNQYNAPKASKVLFIVMGCFMVLMMFDNPEYCFFFKNISIEHVYSVSVFRYEHGYVYILFLIELAIIYVGMTTMLIRKIIKTNRIYRTKLVLLLIGILIPSIGIFYSNFASGVVVELISATMAVSCIIFTINLSRYHMFDVTQNAKEMVVDHLEEGIVVLDEDQKILYFNELVKQLISDDERESNRVKEIILQTKDNEEIKIASRSFRIVISEMKGQHERIEGYLFELHETTEKVAQMEEVARLTDEARSANNAKGQFLASMSHEIRTPINAILGMNEMILRENKEEQITEYASNIGIAGRSLLRLINDILDYSKMESGKVEWINVSYKLKDLLQELELKIFPEIEKKPVTFEIVLGENLPSELFGDEVRVRQVVMNLLSNAVKYTEEGKITLTVSVKDKDQYIEPFPDSPGEWDINFIEYKVSDTGQGIKAENLEKIFESFNRIEEGKNRNIEGAGLGLTLTKKILDHMEGTIEATSEYGKGSVFSVSLPQEVVDKTPLKSVQLTYHSKNMTKHQKNFTISNGTVLVVDDNAVNLKVMNGLLKRTKMKILNAHSGQECLEIVQSQKIDIIFMDHLMPEMDGVETLKQWKQLDGRVSKDISVIALTANANSGSREQYLAYGFTDYLAKPVDAKELENTLLKYVALELIQMDEKEL